MPPRLLPVPLMNVINGGRHADNNLDFQEFMIVPHGAPSFPEAIRQGVEVYHALRGQLTRRSAHHRGRRRGRLRARAGKPRAGARPSRWRRSARSGLEPGRDIALALDCAASELADGDGYVFRKAGGPRRSAADLIALYERWCARYPIVSIEDGLGENDRTGWKALTAALGSRVQLVGDDLFCTNEKLLGRRASPRVSPTRSSSR